MIELLAILSPTEWTLIALPLTMPDNNDVWWKHLMQVYQKVNHILILSVIILSSWKQIVNVTVVVTS